MASELLTSEDVLKRLGAPDFRSINKMQLIRFISSIPEMDKELAKKCIEQFPEFRKQATDIINSLYSFCEKILNSHKGNYEDAVNAYRQILDDLSEQLKTQELSFDEQNIITDKMLDVADRIAILKKESDGFLQNLAHWAFGVATLAIGIGGAILGVKAIEKR